MDSLKRMAPSPALVVAIVALCAALVGTAVAGPVAGISVLNKKEKKQTKKIAKKVSRAQANAQITKRAPNLSVANAQNATNATNAANATNAGNAQTVGGVSIAKIDFRTPGEDGPNTTILDFNGLQMKADCDGANVDLSIESTVAGAEAWWTTNRSFGDPLYDGVDDFGPGDVENIATGKTPRDMGGEIRYIAPGGIAVVNWGADDLGGQGCHVYGVAMG